jgi:hypothetical protein
MADRPPGADEITDTPEELLAGATKATVPTVAPRHRAGGSDQPAGRTAGHDTASGAPGGRTGPAVRRQPAAG